MLGLTQGELATALGCSQTHIWRIESEQVDVSVTQVCEMASILGLEAGLKLFEIGDAIRDKGQQALVGRFGAVVGGPWRRLGQESVMSVSGDQRAWDMELRHPSGQRVGVECETRIRDIQALARRTHLRERDGGMDRIVIVLSDSAHNRRLADQLRDALGDAYRTSPRLILGELRAGRPLTGGGVILV